MQNRFVITIQYNFPRTNNVMLKGCDVFIFIFSQLSKPNLDPAGACYQE